MIFIYCVIEIPTYSLYSALFLSYRTVKTKAVPVLLHPVGNLRQRMVHLILYFHAPNFSWTVIDLWLVEFYIVLGLLYVSIMRFYHTFSTSFSLVIRNYLNYYSL